MSFAIGALLAFGLLIFGLLAATRGPWALLLILLQFPFEQLLQSYFVYFVSRPEAFNLMVGVIAASAFVVTVLRVPGLLSSALNICVASISLYLVVAATSTLWTPLQGGNPFPSGVWAYAGLFVVIGPLLLNGRSDLSTLMKISIVLGTILGLMIVLNPNAEFSRGRYVLRFAGTGSASDSNPLAMADLGGYLVIVASLVRAPTAATIWSIFRVAAVIVGTVLLLDSGSRGQVVLAAVVVLCFYPIANRIDDLPKFAARTLILATILVAAVLAAQYLTSQGTERRWESDAVLEASVGRVENIRILLSAWSREPSKWLQGLGNGAFASLDTGSRQPYVHNIVAEALGEFGVIGFVLLMTALGSAFIAGWRSHKRFTDVPSARSEVSALMASAAFSFLVSNKQGNVWVSMPTFMLLLLVVRFDRATRLQDRGESERMPEEVEAEAGSASLPESWCSREGIG